MSRPKKTRQQRNDNDFRRTDSEISKEYETHRDKVWYTRHKWRMLNDAPPTTKEGIESIKRAKAYAKSIEKKYGRKNLVYDDYEWGLLSGRMSALAWVGGMPWDHSLDT